MTFDPSISLGQIASAGSVIVALAIIWVRMERMIARLDERTLSQGKRLDVLETAVLDRPDPSGYTVSERYP